MSKTEAIRLAMELGSRGHDVTAVGIRYVGKGYSFTTWSVKHPEKIKGVTR